MSAETIKDMTDEDIYHFVVCYRGGIKKDLRRHRIAVIRIWFNLWPSRLWLSKKELPMLYAWIERLENISIDVLYKYAVGIQFKS